MTKYDQIYDQNFWPKFQFFRSEMYPPSPFGNIQKIHPFWGTQASFISHLYSCEIHRFAIYLVHSGAHHTLLALLTPLSQASDTRQPSSDLDLAFCSILPF